MHVISNKYIREFIREHPDSGIKLGRWYTWMKKGKFNNLEELKKRFTDVDYIGNERYVFNIAGNKYRLVAMVNFNAHRVYVRYIGTHANYERIDCQNI